jgi:glycosyltransferase involved in cell wall biosynthesis
VLYLLRGLAARGFEPVLATPPEAPLARRAADERIRVVPLRSRGDLDLGAVRRLRALLGEGFDVLHLHTGHAHALGLLAVAGRRPRPGVVVSRRVDFPPRGPLRALKYGRRVDRFVAVSDAVRGVLLEAGVPPERVVTVHSGIDPARFAVAADPEGLRGELAIPANAKLVGFVGALVPHKSPGDLLEALARLPGGVHAVLAGAGGLEGALRRRAGEDDLRGRVHFLGHREDVPRILRSIDAFCLPSHLEGLGTSVLDALAAGAPVVAAAGGGIPEMVEQGVSGLLVPPGRPETLAEALDRVLADPDLADSLRRGGRRRVEAFTAGRMVEATLAVYGAITGLEKAGTP